MRWLTFAGLFGAVAGVALLAGLWLDDPGQMIYAVSTQQREDQIALGAAGAANDPTFNYVPPTLTPWIAFDAADYPSSSALRLEVIIDLGADQTTCVRLFNLTTHSDIQGSTLCATGAPNGPDRRRLRSGPLTFPVGEHEYTLQGQSQVSIGGSYVQFSRIIVEWSESIAMGPGPNPVGGYVRLVDAPVDQASLAHPASVAMGLMLLGAGGLYIARMRRGGGEGSG